MMCNSFAIFSFKAETLLSFHVNHRKEEREMNPKRFSVRKTIAEKCIQRPKPDNRRESDFSYENDQIKGCIFDTISTNISISIIFHSTYLRR